MHLKETETQLPEKNCKTKAGKMKDRMNSITTMKERSASVNYSLSLLEIVSKEQGCFYGDRLESI